MNTRCEVCGERGAIFVSGVLTFHLLCVTCEERIRVVVDLFLSAAKDAEDNREELVAILDNNQL